MPEISRFFGIVIKMYYNDHAPPHFHAEYNEYVAEIGIETLDIIRGELPRRVLRMVLEWAFMHRNALYANWARARAQEMVHSIEPLE